MSVTTFLLEDFSENQEQQQFGKANPSNKTAEKNAFDDGYRSGWNDAFTEARSDEAIVRSNIATALQELGFTYFEARQHIMGSVRPLLDELLSSVLPKVAAAALIPLLEEELEKLVDMVEPPVKMLVSPQNLVQLNALVTSNSSIPIEVEAEDTLTAGQIRLTYPNGFSALDTDAVIERIQMAVASFFEATPERSKVNA